MLTYIIYISFIHFVLLCHISVLYGCYSIFNFPFWSPPSEVCFSFPEVPVHHWRCHEHGIRWTNSLKQFNVFKFMFDFEDYRLSTSVNNQARETKVRLLSISFTLWRNTWVIRSQYIFLLRDTWLHHRHVLAHISSDSSRILTPKKPLLLRVPRVVGRSVHMVVWRAVRRQSSVASCLLECRSMCSI